MTPLTSPLSGTVVHVVAVGGAVRAGQGVVVIESMKLEHPVASPHDGVVAQLDVRVGDSVERDQRLAVVEPAVLPAVREAPPVNPALEELRRRQAARLDEARPEQVSRRHERGGRTARENVDDLLDPGSFDELGGLALAAQRSRDEADLIARTPADGVVTGFGTVDGSPVAVLAYDSTVLAGTQGLVGHRKTDRLLDLVARRRTPVVLYAEGGGGRPSDTDGLVVSALDTRAFVLWAGLSGLVPRIAVVNGNCFAGNAALAGAADLVVATASTSWGMGGPAMIEGGGLGVVAAADVGPLAVQVAAGTVDVAVADEAEATSVARRLVSLLSGAHVDGEAGDQTTLRDLALYGRQSYDVRGVLYVLFDTGSVLMLREHWAPEMVTALARLDGRAVGVIANNPQHLGAITSNGADKAARFLQLCDAHGLPVISLVDTPGIMVGLEAEATGLVRHAARLFVAGATLRVPFLAVVLRRAYGLGAQAMLGGGTREPLLTLAWPTGELAPMGLEGAVRLGMRRELEAIADPYEQEAEVARVVALLTSQAAAVNVASVFEIDDVIDPADTRARLSAALRDLPAPAAGRKVIDTW